VIDTIANIFTGGLGTGVLGVLSGLVGGVVTSITNYKMKKLQMEERSQERIHEKDMLAAETEAMIAESKAKIEVAKEQTAGAIELSELDAYKESQKETGITLFQSSYMGLLPDNKLGSFCKFFIAISFAFVDVLKGTARPVLTYYTMILATIVTYMAYEIVGKKGIIMTPEQAYSLFNLAIQTIWYLAVTSYAWWFADRRAAKFMAKQIGWGNGK